MALSRITLVGHTHWDREWYEPFEVMRAHLVTVLDQAMDVLEQDGRQVFTLDGHVALIDDYLELRPQAEPRLRALVGAGRLRIGPLYTQADTLLADGESIIRNLIWGIRRSDQLGGATRFGYMPDQFGHAAQVPQILRLFGIHAAAVWRGIGPERPTPVSRWVSPDGSMVTLLWLHEGYGSGRRLPSDPHGFADAIERQIDRLGDWLGHTLLVPVGDDHVALPQWLPAAAAELQARHPGTQIVLGGYGDHLLPGQVAGPGEGHVLHGELRSPAFAPVLAGVASARMSEKQAAQRTASLLQRYAEPLSCWAALAGTPPRQELLDHAWRQLLLNHAHDSIAGCGADAAHKDVSARYRQAIQLGELVRDQALSSLPPIPGAPLVAFHPGPRAASLLCEVDIPRALPGPVCAVGPDGVLRPVQLLSVVPGEAHDQPLFEGEFSAAEMTMYLGGLDPATPLFGKYLGGIAAHPEGPGRVRLDIGLGSHPAPAVRLAEDQRRVMAMLPYTERFRIVLHGGDPTRRALVQVGPAPEAGFVPISIVAGEQTPGLCRAHRRDGDVPGIACGPLRVTPGPFGSVLIVDEALGLSVRANDLIDEGDRGDLYHFDPTADPPQQPRHARVLVVEDGPLRASLRIEQEFELPPGLLEDRLARGGTPRRVPVVTEVSVTAGERRVDFVTTLVNETRDHRLRALCHVPFRVDHLDVEHGLAVLPRPLDPAVLGQGIEQPAPTGQHHGFADVRGGGYGVALFSRGLPEHEVVRSPDGTFVLALTLLRSVGWLARGDLRCVSHAVGPMLPTPDAQEQGPHRFEYSLLLHAGDWDEAGILPESRRYAAPAIAGRPDGSVGDASIRALPMQRALVEIEPAQVMLSATYPARDGRGLVVRVVNASSRAALASIRPALPAAFAVEVDPLEAQVAGSVLSLENGVARLPLRPWQIATLLFRDFKPG